MPAEPVNQPSPEEQQRQQAAAARGAAAPGRGAAGPTGDRADVGDAPMESAMGGAGDTDSGGGNAAGTPDADTAQRAGEPVTRGDARQDRQKVFPESDQSRKGADADRPRGD